MTDTTNNDDDDHEAVGYGRPPKRHQFKPGISGNPKGRARRPRTPSEALAKIRDEIITVMVDGQPRRMNRVEAAIRANINNCMRSANPVWTAKLVEVLEKCGVPHSQTLAEDSRRGADAAIEKIMTYARRVHVEPPPNAAAALEREEIAILKGCPRCQGKLQDRWATEPAEAPPSRLRKQWLESSDTAS